jgi:hypothetical protein
MDPLTIGVLAAVVLLFLFVVARQNTLFVISVRSGRSLVVRGRVPPGFLADVRAIVRGVESATIRAVKDQGGARLTASGVDERVLQRLRNAFSVYPAARLRAAPPIQRPTLGQILGIAWLAWLLDRR